MENEVKTELRPEALEAEGSITVKRNKTLDFIAKIICLLLAFFLWYYAVSVDTVIDEEEFAAIPVEIVNQSGFAVLSGDGMTVDVTVSGNRNTLHKIKNSDIRAYVDVSNVTTAGEKFFDIVFKLPNGVKLEKSSAGTVMVYLDNKISKTIPVSPKLFNYRMSSEHELVTSNIPDIVITGPEQIVNDITAAELPVDFQNSEIASGRIYSGKLGLVGEGGGAISESDRRYIRLSTDTASVTVSLYGSATIPVTVTFKHGLQNPDNCNIKLSRSSLTVYGEISAIKDVSVNCVIDEKTLKSGSSLSFGVGLPTGVKNVDGVDSVKVTVTLKRFSEKSLEIPVLDIEGNVIATINARFRGPSDLMSRFTSEYVKATASEGSSTVQFEFLGEFSSGIYEIYKEGSPYTVG